MWKRSYRPPQTGYAYIYLTNESNSSMPIYFDDLTVDHKSRVVQQLDYYPFGLEMAHSWEQLPNATANPYRYNAGAEKNNQTGNYETLFRQYDPAIGRMLAVDPVAAKYSSVSPYNYAFNDPVFWNDPSGADPNDWNYTDEYIDQYQNDVIYRDHGPAYVEGHGSPALSMLNGISAMMNGDGQYHGERGAGLIDWGVHNMAYAMGQLEAYSDFLSANLIGGIAAGLASQFGGTVDIATSGLNAFTSNGQAFAAGFSYNYQHNSFAYTVPGSMGGAMTAFALATTEIMSIGLPTFGKRSHELISYSRKGRISGTGPFSLEGFLQGLPVNLNASDRTLITQLQKKLHVLHSSRDVFYSQEVLDYTNLNEKWETTEYKRSTRFLNDGQIMIGFQGINGLRRFSFWMQFPGNGMRSNNYQLKGIRTFPKGFQVETAGIDYPFQIVLKGYDRGKENNVDFLRIGFKNRSDFYNWRKAIINGN